MLWSPAELLGWYWLYRWWYLPERKCSNRASVWSSTNNSLGTMCKRFCWQGDQELDRPTPVSRYRVIRWHWRNHPSSHCLLLLELIPPPQQAKKIRKEIRRWTPTATAPTLKRSPPWRRPRPQWIRQCVDGRDWAPTCTRSMGTESQPRPAAHANSTAIIP
jgi:hypothetical protein